MVERYARNHVDPDAPSVMARRSICENWIWRNYAQPPRVVVYERRVPHVVLTRTVLMRMGHLVRSHEEWSAVLKHFTSCGYPSKLKRSASVAASMPDWSFISMMARIMTLGLPFCSILVSVFERHGKSSWISSGCLLRVLGMLISMSCAPKYDFMADRVWEYITPDIAATCGLVRYSPHDAFYEPRIVVVLVAVFLKILHVANDFGRPGSPEPFFRATGRGGRTATRRILPTASRTPGRCRSARRGS